MEKDKRPLIILTGPTAAGKTSLSIALAKRIGGEIISADSMQIYKKMDIGTAKIRPEEMQGVPHYLVDELDPGESFNVVRFVRRARQAMEEIYEREHIPILVGGTGFYIQALLYDIDFSEHASEEAYRKELAALADEKGAEHLHEMLESVDPDYAREVHFHNVKKVIRALEYYKETGERLSEHNKKQRQKASPYCFAYFVLTHDRETLYQRIDHRVDQMMEAGLEQEVAALVKEGYGRELVSMQGLGYKEFFPYFAGEVSLAETVDVIKRDTRRFAKRQLTWFRRERDVIWLNKKDYEDEAAILAAMTERLEERGIRKNAGR